MSAVPRTMLTAFLADLDELGYAVAKAPDIWGNLERGGDWDLVVLDVDRSLRRLAHHAGPPDVVERHSYVTSAHYPWGRIDLLPGLAWRGVQLAGAEDVVAGASEGGSGARVASVPHQVLAACVYPMLAHGTYRKRYEPLLASMTDDDRAVLDRVLGAVFGVRSGALARVLDPAQVRRMRRRATVRALRNPAGMRRLSRFVALELWTRSRRRLVRRATVTGTGEPPRPGHRRP